MSTDSTTAKLTNESSGNATTKVLTGVQNTDPSRFIGTGVNFKAKLIGWEDVPESRGEKMCHVSMAKLKAVVVAMKEHKRQISLNISMEGIKLTDEKTQEILHNHPVHEISFIFRDSTDSRAFGYIHKVNENTHRFFGIKTEKAAANVINSLRDLFQAVYAMKKDEPSESKEEIKEQESPSNNEMNNNINNNVETKSEPMIKDEVPVEQTKKSNPSEDLFQLDEASNTTTAQNTAVAQSNAWLMQAFASSGQAGYPPAPTASAVVVTGPGSYPPQQPIMSAHVRQQTLYAQQQGGHPTPVWPPSSVPQGQFPNGYLANSGFPASSMATYGQQSRTFQATTVSSNQAGVNWSTFDQGGQTSTNDPFSFNGPAGQPPVQAQAKLSPTSDPFKDLGNLSISTTTGIPLQANKRITKDDFNKDSPKPSLLDLSQQQPKQNQGVQAPKEQSADPFGLDTVSYSNKVYDPFDITQKSNLNNLSISHAYNNHTSSLIVTPNNMSPGSASRPMSGGFLTPPPSTTKRRNSRESRQNVKPVVTNQQDTSKIYDPWASPLSPKNQQMTTNPFGTSNDPFA